MFGRGGGALTMISKFFKVHHFKVSSFKVQFPSFQFFEDPQARNEDCIITMIVEKDLNQLNSTLSKTVNEGFGS